MKKDTQDLFKEVLMDSYIDGIIDQTEIINKLLMQKGYNLKISIPTKQEIIKMWENNSKRER